MKLSIGENIKFFRKSKDITQEQLAEMLGISFQSVSRWELNICYPDIEFLPTLAEIFETTVDKLLGVDNIAETKNVDKYLNRFQVAISQGKIDECISIARDGVKEYPNNYALLNKLMYALFVAGDETGNIPNWKENIQKYDAEITALGERIMKYCPDQNIRLEATARLAFNHCENGRKETGRQIYDSLPPITLCRENQMWWSLREDEKLPFLQRQIKKCYEMLKNYMHTLATCGKLSSEDSISVINKWEMLNDLMCDKQQSNISLWENVRVPCDKAKLYAKIGDKDKVLNLLKSAAQKAIDFDNRPNTQNYNCLLLGGVTVNKIDFETADSRTLCEIMRNKWLAHKDFDFIRNTPKFQKIIDMLNTL